MEEKENKDTKMNNENMTDENKKTDNIEVEDLQEINLDKLSAKQTKETLKKYLDREKDLKEQAEKINSIIIDLKKQAEDFKDKWMRTTAEFENYKKRTALTRIQSIEDGKSQILLKILPIGDNLERAINLPLDDKTKEGINLLIRNFKEMLSNEGVTEINPIGEKFDPNMHEALMQVEAVEGDISGNVKDVFIKGYKLGDKIIRYAQVRVIN
jgi:molecular chaperone GrpE